MKKIVFTSMCLVAALSLMTTACKKESGSIDFSATIENYNGDNKVHIDANLYPVWDDGDQVKINTGSYGVTVTGTGETAVAKIQGVTETGTIYALYPASIVTTTCAASTNIILPRRQTYNSTNPSKVEMPMCATADGSNLAFHNLCALVRVTVTNNTGSAFTLDSIEISSAKAVLAGKGTVTMSSNALVMGKGSGSYKYVRLVDINTEIANGSNATFYVIVPPIDHKALDVMIYTNKGNYNQTSASATLQRNKIGPLAMTPGSTSLQIGKGVTAGQDWVQLWAGGTKWATCNIGSTTALGVGYFFSWGNVDGQNQNGSGSYVFSTANYSSTPGYSLATNIPADDTTQDAASKLWGGGWRLPTSTEFQSLIDNTNKSASPSSGYVFTGTQTGYTTNSIAFPFADRYDGSNHNTGSKMGYYWSSTYQSTDAASILSVVNAGNTSSVTTNSRYMGLPIRPVCD